MGCSWFRISWCRMCTVSAYSYVFFLLCFFLSRSFWPRNVPLGMNPLCSFVVLRCTFRLAADHCSVLVNLNCKFEVRHFNFPRARAHWILYVAPVTWAS